MVSPNSALLEISEYCVLLFELKVAEASSENRKPFESFSVKEKVENRMASDLNGIMNLMPRRRSNADPEQAVHIPKQETRRIPKRGDWQLLFISSAVVSHAFSNLEWIFLAINVLIEISSAIFEQISSKHKPIYALVVMLMSFSVTLLSIIALACKARKEEVVWKWERGMFPWFYQPSPSNRRFGTFPEIFGLVCAILQSIVSAIVYGLYLHHTDYPIKISFWPLIFSVGLLWSKFMENQDQNNIPSVTSRPEELQLASMTTAT